MKVVCGKRESAGRGTFLAETLSNEPLCREHYLLRLAVTGFGPTGPGQFVQLQCSPPTRRIDLGEVRWRANSPPKLSQKELVGREPLLRRPFSLAGRTDLADGRCNLEIVYRTVGTGTRWLAGVEPGQPLSLLGPLGNTFPDGGDKPAAALVGGGVGIGPMLYLAEALSRAGKEVVAFNGVRGADFLPLRLIAREPPSSSPRPTLCVKEFARWSVKAVVATEDGSLGWPGMVSEAFEKWLGGRSDREGIVVHCCGPEPMMQAVAAACIDGGIECHLAMERHMACGVGTCQSCVFKVRADNRQGWTYKLVCKDGPIFNARDIIWQ